MPQQQCKTCRTVKPYVQPFFYVNLGEDECCVCRAMRRLQTAVRNEVNYYHHNPESTP